MDAWLEAVSAEWAARRHEVSPPLRSVFVGGGTPTVLGADRLGRLLGLLANWIGGRAEVTVEANPAMLTPDLCRALAEGGVNRVSLGAQSFREAELALLGRLHGPTDIDRACDAFRRAGVNRLSLDLIYGLPGQSLADWRDTVRRAVTLGVGHLSCYALGIEPGTPLAADVRAGRQLPADEDLQREMFYCLDDDLADAGLRRYELSNFAQAGQACEHNLTYWHNGAYLGLGPAAASCIDGVRRTNRPDLDRYCQTLRGGQLPPAEQERLEGDRALAETLMLGLRLIGGLDIGDLTARFGISPVEVFPKTARRYRQMGLLHVENDRIRLDRQAWFVSDAILADFLTEAKGTSPETTAP
jgi:oxygen-independent coproporphyrinogen III oxidase